MAVIEKSLWQAVSPLLDELLEADDTRRAERLEQIRGTDRALADEVAGLLARHAVVETRHFLEGSALDLVGEPTLAGRTIGSYTLERALGAGGMGSVWLARRSDGRFEGQAAVKFLNLALLGRGGAERFKREGDVLARLTHPNIARLLDAGVADSQPYLVLEYVDGPPLDAWCDAHRLDVEARLRLFLDAAAAVAHAHNNLILHRDLKPSNILVRKDGQVKLLDFGIAKLLENERQGAPATELTQVAGRAFTPDYAAPEQVQGAQATMASDVYALGVLLYLLLTGRHPTARPGQPMHEQLRAVLEQEPVPAAASARDTSPAAAAARATTPHKLAREVRGDLENIAAKALKKNPAERYATVTAFADDLRRYLDDQPVSARRDSVVYRYGKFVRRNRLAVAAGCSVVLALLAGVIGTAWQAIEARRERDEALFQAASASARGNLVNLLLSSIGEGGRPLTQREILELSVQLVEKQFARNPQIAVSLLLPIAGQYYTMGDVEKDFAVMRRAAEIAARSGAPQLIASVACNTVNTEIRRNRLDQAKAQLAAGLQALQRAERPRFVTVVSCLRAEADVAAEEGDLDRAVELMAQALRRIERDGHTGGNMLPSTLSSLAFLHETRGDLAASYGVLKRMQRDDEALGQVASFDHFSSYGGEAGILMKWGEYGGARAILDDVEARIGVAERETRPIWVDLRRGLILLRFGDAEGASRKFTEAAERARARGYVEAIRAAELLQAQALLGSGRLEAAARQLAVFDTEPAPADVRYARASVRTVRAALLLAQGDVARAAREIENEIVRLGAPTLRNQIALGEAARVAARVHAAGGEVQGSLLAARRAVDLAGKVARDAARSADVGEALLLLAQAERRAGERERAIATARRAAASLAQGLDENHRLTREARALSEG